MWLINTTTRQLKDFIGKPPQYAILSHTWESDQEISLKEYQSPTPVNAGKIGSQKINAAIELARNDSYEWLWVDTCCIDKSSSAELSEAINSMFKWYQNATVCYVYLADVDAGSEPSFRSSRWFTRGWTLQELIAPANLIFFDRHWTEIGTKLQYGRLLSDITGVDLMALSITHIESDLGAFSVAKRMSWASQRQTTRPEDLAYCLLGIFGVHMPLLYGEGAEQSFFRLQEAIMQMSDDQTIFAWNPLQSMDELDGSKTWRGPRITTVSILAPGPACFRESAEYRPLIPVWKASTYYSSERSKLRSPQPFTMTSKGLYGTFLIHRHSVEPAIYHIALECGVNGEERATIAVTRTGPASNQFARLRQPTAKVHTSAMFLSTVDGNTRDLARPLGLSRDLWYPNLIFVAQHNLLGAPRSALQATRIEVHVETSLSWEEQAKDREQSRRLLQILETR